MKKITQIINLKTAIVAALSVLSTYLCIEYNLVADFPFTIVATAVIFPIVFSIGGAYKRRENALAQYGVMKAHARAMYFASRDWLEKPKDDIQGNLKALLKELFDGCQNLFTNDQDKMRENEREVYRSFSRLSKFIKSDLRANGLPSGECSRCNQYLSKTMVAFENVKHIYQYRTPKSLRAFCDVFIFMLPFVYGPYFAHLATEVTPGLEYVMPVLFSVVLVALDNIQEHLENPFDQVGDDDIYINTDIFLERLDLE